MLITNAGHWSVSPPVSRLASYYPLYGMMHNVKIYLVSVRARTWNLQYRETERDVSAKEWNWKSVRGSCLHSEIFIRRWFSPLVHSVFPRFRALRFFRFFSISPLHFAYLHTDTEKHTHPELPTRNYPEVRWQSFSAWISWIFALFSGILHVRESWVFSAIAATTYGGKKFYPTVFSLPREYRFSRSCYKLSSLARPRHALIFCDFSTFQYKHAYESRDSYSQTTQMSVSIFLRSRPLADLRTFSYVLSVEPIGHKVYFYVSWIRAKLVILFENYRGMGNGRSTAPGKLFIKIKENLLETNKKKILVGWPIRTFIMWFLIYLCIWQYHSYYWEEFIWVE